jgi:hypothetical protein
VTVNRRKGDPGLADILFSRIVRSRAVCERCGLQATDTAHIVGRRYSATRCVEDNAWALCRQCHNVTGQWPHKFMALVAATIGEARYHELYRQASAGLPCSSHVFWAGEVDRLKARCAELGIDIRRKAA